ncbi:MAG: hypothetical protein CVU63_08450 [Deltaproteobacteria bacterium HGW-Deltaproteobacteria-20]|jgi:DNA-binding MarR family transcriptional regulator|nr:MAG: hypothetical protein CVU63_08450 [Deltaproteobacteria bacterium HGW-Deltaproteobacteria-20]
MTRPGSAPPPLDPAHADVEIKLERMGELVKRMLTSVRMPEDASELTPTQIAVLCILEEGPQRVGVLASAIGAAQNTISEVVARLQRTGLVGKDRDPVDQRAVLVALTERGLQALHKRRAAMRSAHRTILQALAVEDRQRFVDAFELLVELTERARLSIARTQAKPHPKAKERRSR